MSKIIVNRGKGYYEFNLTDTGTLDNMNTLIVDGVVTVYDKELDEQASHWDLEGKVLRWNDSKHDFDEVCLTNISGFDTLLEEHIWREFGFSVALYSVRVNNSTRGVVR